MKFCNDVQFQKDPRFLLYCHIVERIKKLTCINIDGQCKSCPLTNSCIYHYLSGENFQQFPGIIINRRFIEKTKYQKEEKMNIDIYMIGSCSQYEEYITSIIANINMLENQLIEVDIRTSQRLEEGVEIATGKYRCEGPIKKVEYIGNQVNYYNNKYNCHFSPADTVIPIKTIYLYDEKYYSIAKKSINISGITGVFQFKGIDAMLLKLGLGKNSYLCWGENYAYQD